MHRFLSSSNWCIEGEEAFFLSITFKMVFRVNLKTCQCDALARVPDFQFKKYNFDFYCQKYQNKLFCFPYKQGKIGCYDLEKSEWREIEVGYETPLMYCTIFPSDANKIWLLEHKGKRIFQINLEREKCEQEYSSLQDGSHYNCQYVFVNKKLYYIVSSKVCCIDSVNRTNNRYDIGDVDCELNTIYYDGQNFWLSGIREEIYIWNPVQGVVKVVKNILNGYHLTEFERRMIVSGVPLFNYSVLLGEYIWFIPIQMNAPIIYIHKKDYAVNILDVPKEKETEDTLKKRGNAFKYRVIYVYNERYIGIFSLKEQKVFEIDTKELQIIEKNYTLSSNTENSIANAYYNTKNILYESNEFERTIFSILLRNNQEKREINCSNRGMSIYAALKNKGE